MAWLRVLGRGVTHGFLAVKACQGMLREVDREPSIVLRQPPYVPSPQYFCQEHVVLFPTKNTCSMSDSYMILKCVRTEGGAEELKA